MIKKICKNCGKEFETRERRGIFCSRRCANYYNTKGRKHTEEEKIKISHALQRRNPNFNGEYKEREPTQQQNYFNFDAGKEYFCLNCNKRIETKYASKSNKFCNWKCQREYEYKVFIGKWKSGEETGLVANYSLSSRVRRYMLEKAGYKCEECGFNKLNPFTKRPILQIHHIDGNCQNNQESNLKVLCPNCHAMTENFGSRNVNATKGRTQYYSKSKRWRDKKFISE